MSVLDVYFRQAHCARLTRDAHGSLGFQYLDSWLKQGNVPVSLTLPLNDVVYEHDRVTRFIAHFLPEGRDLRRRLERLLRIDAEDDFGLLSVIGRECAGALSFWPEGDSPQDIEPRYAQLSVAAFHEWRAFAHQQPLQFNGQTLRQSLAGVHAKTALYFDLDDNPCLPKNGAPSSHILKPGIPGCLPHAVHTEYLTMKIACAVLGVDRVPTVDLWQDCYRIRRFDRPRPYQKLRRLHQEDFCLALSRMPARKYESAHTAENLLSACFHLLDQLGEQGLVSAPAIERQRLLNQVILNVLLHNPGAHLKNYALMLQDNGKICVTPLYDSLCTYGLNFAATGTAWARHSGPVAYTRRLSLRIGNALAIDAISQQDWQQFAVECGFTAAFVRRRVLNLADTVHDALPHALSSVLDEHPLMKQAAEAVRAGVTKQVSMAACGQR